MKAIELRHFCQKVHLFDLKGHVFTTNLSAPVLAKRPPARYQAETLAPPLGVVSKVGEIALCFYAEKYCLVILLV